MPKENYLLGLACMGAAQLCEMWYGRQRIESLVYGGI